MPASPMPIEQVCSFELSYDISITDFNLSGINQALALPTVAEKEVTRAKRVPGGRFTGQQEKRLRSGLVPQDLRQVENAIPQN